MLCLILGPMLASQLCLHAFWVLTSLHLFSFKKKMFLLFLFPLFFFLNIFWEILVYAIFWYIYLHTLSFFKCFFNFLNINIGWTSLESNRDRPHGQQRDYLHNILQHLHNVHNYVFQVHYENMRVEWILYRNRKRHPTI